MSRQAGNHIAWMTDESGRLMLGRGPFAAHREPPAESRAFYVNDFALSDPAPWKIPTHWEIVDESAPDESSARPPVIDWQAVETSAFSRVFQEASTYIQAGNFEKTVPVVTETGRISSGSAEWFALRSRETKPPLVSYGWAQGETGFAGATPERLFTLAQGTLKTMALAGTARSKDRDVFAADEKEIREHEYVARTLVSKLAHLGEVVRHAREIIDLGNLVHFLSRIELQPARPLDPQELIRFLHPTPALGPLPRTPENLAILIGWRRQMACPESFGAPFGLWDKGNFHAVVSIRGIWWNRNQVHLPAGCGIIEASRLVNEWRELRLKRDAVKTFFGLV